MRWLEAGTEQSIWASGAPERPSAGSESVLEQAQSHGTKAMSRAGRVGRCMGRRIYHGPLVKGFPAAPIFC